VRFYALVGRPHRGVICNMRRYAAATICGQLDKKGYCGNLCSFRETAHGGISSRETWQTMLFQEERTSQCRCVIPLCILNVVPTCWAKCRPIFAKKGGVGIGIYALFGRPHMGVICNVGRTPIAECHMPGVRDNRGLSVFGML